MSRDLSISREGTSTAELRPDVANGQVPVQDRALLERVLSGRTTWHAVRSGHDDHWTAVEHRERAARTLGDGLRDLLVEDEELAALVQDLQRRTRGAVDG